MTEEIVFNGFFVVIASLLVVANQYLQFRKEQILAREEAIKKPKLAVIQQLIAYRFVLLGRENDGSEAKMHFNSALNSVPVYFSDNKKCIDIYRSIGFEFSADKFYLLIVALMEDVPLDTKNMDKHVLEIIPHVSV